MKKEIRNSALKRLSTYLSENKLRATTQRETILTIFTDLGRHITAEELYEILRKHDSSIGHATVYRALRLFVDAGLVRELNFNDGVLRYETLTGKEPQDYIICVKCGIKIAFIDDRIREIQDEIAKKHGFALTKVNHTLFGKCAKCIKQEAR
jgi:Fur family ferric uptake transcriptional regulator